MSCQPTCKTACDCCTGVQAQTPMPIANRPGLAALSYRVGVHGAFLETMKARLASLRLPAGLDPLRKLTTRAENDPSIALLDAWATVADVLTFYQERIANEGYLLTATERRSILELTNLVGYRLRPGVAASTFLAFTLEEGHEVEIPAGTRAQSLPGPGELPQPFETAEPIIARAEWNALRPRLTQLQVMNSATHTLYLQGITTNLKPNDPLLIVGAPTATDAAPTFFRRAFEIALDPVKGQTIVYLIGDLDLRKLNSLIAANPGVWNLYDLPGPITPAHLATDVPINSVLTWREQKTPGGPFKYRLWFGTANPPPLAGEFDQATHTPQLESGRRYRWRVAAVSDPCGDERSIFYFDTVKDLDRPVPFFSDTENYAQGVPTDQTLRWRWRGHDAGESGVTFKVALGTSENDLKSSDTLETPAYKPKLEANQTYFWRVTATLTDGRTVTGALWRFTTATEHTFTNVAPAHDASTAPVTQNLGWQWGGAASATFRVEWGTDPTNLTRVDIGSATTFTPPQPLTPGTTYFWRVSAIAATAGETGGTPSVLDISPLWRFVVANAAAMPIAPFDRATGVQFGTSLQWEAPEVVGQPILFRVRYGKSSNQLNQDSGPLSAPSFTPTLDQGADYFWQVQTLDNTHRVIGVSRIQRFRTAFARDPQRAGAGNLMIALVRAFLQYLEFSYLRISSFSGAELGAQIEIERSPYKYVRQALEALASITGSDLDYCDLLDWLERVDKELEAVDGQLDLRRTEGTATRIYPNLFVNPETVRQILNQRDNKPASDPQSPDLALVSFGKSAVDSVHNDIADLLDTLRASAKSEDEKITAVPITQRRLTMLLYTFHIMQWYELGHFASQIHWVEGWLQLLGNATISAQSTASLPTLIRPLLTPPTRPPANALRLGRSVDQVFSQGSDIAPRILTALQHQLEDTLFQAWALTQETPLASQQSAQALRVKAAPFGARFPEVHPTYKANGDLDKYVNWTLADFIDTNALNRLTLDAEYNQIMAGQWVVIEWPEGDGRPKIDENDANPDRLIRRVVRAQTLSKPDYGKVTELILDKEWLTADNTQLAVLRRAVVYAHSEELPLAEEPIQVDVQLDTIQLNGLYAGLDAGRWLIISGERTDIPTTTGFRASEVVMLTGVSHSVQQIKVDDRLEDLRGDRVHTTLRLANSLAYRYKRDTVTVYGNVAKATHGETRTEVLGSSDGRQQHQSFTLKQAPLTYVAAPTASGTQSTLEVRVNNVRWHEAENLIFLDANDRAFVTETDNESKTTTIFGDGKHGARLPTGIENIKAVYRTGIGQVGNVAAERISLLATKPLGVKEVINPLPATGGADRESRDQARSNAPLAVMALDRLVSMQDYADFAHTFAGIGKANAVRLIDGRREFIHLTIAGTDDIPIAVDSDLFQTLFQALHKFGEPFQQLQVALREQILLVISANVRLQPDYEWESVAPQIRNTLLDTFSFDRQRLGQDVLLSEVISVIQAIPGVAYVDIDILDGIPEKMPRQELETLAPHLKRLDRLVVQTGRIQTTHQVDRGNQTFASVAARYEGVSEEQLRRANENVKEIEVTDATGKPTTVLPLVTLVLPTRLVRPAEIAYLSPKLPDLLILKEVTA